MKRFLLIFIILAGLFTIAFAQPDGSNRIADRAVDTGVGLGVVIAVVTSWSRNRSVGWAILHGILTWVYVIYFVLSRSPEDRNH